MKKIKYSQNNIKTDGPYCYQVNRVEEETPEIEMDSISNFTISEVESVFIGKEELTEEVPECLEVNFSGESSSTTDVWLDAPIKLMLSYLEEFTPKIGKTFDLKNKSKMWQRINEKLTEAGYSFTPVQVYGKYRSLERRYKKTKLHNLRTGKNKSIPYQDELEKLISEKKIHPEFVVDSDPKVKMMPDEMNAPSTSDGPCSPVHKNPKQPKSAQEKIFKRIEEIGKERAAYHSRVLKFLEHKEAIEKERNELLRIIASKLNK